MLINPNTTHSHYHYDYVISDETNDMLAQFLLVVTDEIKNNREQFLFTLSLLFLPKLLHYSNIK